MLINSESSFNAGDIIALKNVLGEEIICEFVKEDSDNYIVKCPFAMAMSQGGAGFAPPVMFAKPIKDMKDKEVTLRKAHIMFAFEAREDITQAYKAETTGIVQATPQEQKIITG